MRRTLVPVHHREDNVRLAMLLILQRDQMDVSHVSHFTLAKDNYKTAIIIGNNLEYNGDLRILHSCITAYITCVLYELRLTLRELPL